MKYFYPIEEVVWLLIDFVEKKVIICLYNVPNDSIRIDKIIFQKYYHKHKSST